MWNDIETLERMAAAAPYVFLLIGLILAFSGQFVQSLIEKHQQMLRSREKGPEGRLIHGYFSHEESIKLVPYAFILLGFLVAALGMLVQSEIEGRVSELRTEAIQLAKKTPPEIDAYLAGNQNDTCYLVLESTNLIPFKAHWRLIDAEDHVIGGVMTNDMEFQPDSTTRKFKIATVITCSDPIVDYVQLVVDYASLYEAEFNYPTDLRGKIVKEYKHFQGGWRSRGQ